MSIKTTIVELLRDSTAASMTEYGLLISGIGLALFGASQGFSYGNQLMWDLVHDRYIAATGATTA